MNAGLGFEQDEQHKFCYTARTRASAYPSPWYIYTENFNMQVNLGFVGCPHRLWWLTVQWNDITVHKSSHWITNCLTSGGTGQCLQTTEASGIVYNFVLSKCPFAGWSDGMVEHMSSSSPCLHSWQTPNSDGLTTKAPTFRTMLQQHGHSTTAPGSVHAITLLMPLSILSGTPPSSSFMRSTVSISLNCCPLLNSQHPDIGEVWTNLLCSVYAALIEASGLSSTAMDNPLGMEGNNIWLHLFIDCHWFESLPRGDYIDVLSLQPCSPTHK